jgi:hypothetical protein
MAALGGVLQRDLTTIRGENVQPLADMRLLTRSSVPYYYYYYYSGFSFYIAPALLLCLRWLRTIWRKSKT